MSRDTEPLRVGLVGLGAVAEAHLAGAAAATGVRVVAGAEPEPSRCEAMARRWGIAGYRDTAAMLAAERLDIACILAPARHHRELAAVAADHGAHVLCEKPLATTVADAVAIVDHCARRGVRLAYGSTYRFLPAVREAHHLVRTGGLGEITLLSETLVGGEGPEAYRDLGPHHYPPGTPGGGGKGLVDHGIHLVDVFRWLTGSEVEAVTGRGNLSGGPPASEVMTMLFASGAVGQLLYNEATFPADLPGEGAFGLGGRWEADGRVVSGGAWDPHPVSIQVHGTRGALRILPYAHHLFLSSAQGMTEVALQGAPMPGNFTAQLESFACCIRERREPEVSGEDGVRALAVVLAAYRAAAERRFVDPREMA